MNGVNTRKHRLLRFSDEPNYEKESVESIKSYVNSEDKVVVLGGGFGVTTVWAARVGSEVTVFEAAKQRIATVREAAELNGVANKVTVHHSIIGEAKRTIGDSSNASIISPTELPDCDVLEIDIEGAELGVLSELTIRPPVIIVETHAYEQSSVRDVKSILTEMNYNIADLGKQSGDISIVTAVRE